MIQNSEIIKMLAANQRKQENMRNYCSPEFTLVSAKNKLVGDANHWYIARRNKLSTWEQFRVEFSSTFIHEENLTHLWKTRI